MTVSCGVVPVNAVFSVQEPILKGVIVLEIYLVSRFQSLSVPTVWRRRGIENIIESDHDQVEEAWSVVSTRVSCFLAI